MTLYTTPSLYIFDRPICYSIQDKSPSTTKMYLICMCALAWARARVFKNDVITTFEYIKYTTHKKLGTSMKNWWSLQVRINSVLY